MAIVLITEYMLLRSTVCDDRIFYDRYQLVATANEKLGYGPDSDWTHGRIKIYIHKKFKSTMIVFNQ
jgi:hypothetical protein